MTYTMQQLIDKGVGGSLAAMLDFVVEEPNQIMSRPEVFANIESADQIASKGITPTDLLDALLSADLMHWSNVGIRAGADSAEAAEIVRMSEKAQKAPLALVYLAQTATRLVLVDVARDDDDSDKPVGILWIMEQVTETVRSLPLVRMGLYRDFFGKVIRLDNVGTYSSGIHGGIAWSTWFYPKDKLPPHYRDMDDTLLGTLAPPLVLNPPKSFYSVDYEPERSAAFRELSTPLTYLSGKALEQLIQRYDHAAERRGQLEDVAALVARELAFLTPDNPKSPEE